MKRCICIMLYLVMLLYSQICGTVYAASKYAPYEYLEEQGFDIEWLCESPGWRTCNIMGGDDYYALSISDLKDDWTVHIDNPTLNEKRKLEEAFVYLVQNFDWDVSFFWPGYANGDLMEISFNIVRDAHKTKRNYSSPESYANALKKWFSIEDQASESESISFDIDNWEEILSELARQYSEIETELFTVNAQYIPAARCFNLKIKSEDITHLTWQLCDSDVKDEYREIFDDLVSTINSTVSKLNRPEISTVVSFVLSENELVFFNVNGIDI